MAPKKATPMEELPSASSSSEEEEMTSEEEEEKEEEEEESSSEEEEEEVKTQKPSLPRPQTQTQTPKPEPEKLDSVKSQAGSESEGESDSGSDSDESESGSEPEITVKPIASKPMAAEGTTPVKNTKTSASKPMAAEETTPLKTTMPRYKPSEKRVSETDRSVFSPTDAKRAKKDGETGENLEDMKKQLKGKWSEDDEIALLEGILEYTEKKGIDPHKDLSKEMDSFHKFIKERLHFNVNTTQLKDKIWRTKKKFNIDVSEKKGKDVTFSKPHDQKLSDLTKKLWGNGIIGEGRAASSMKSNGKVEKSKNNINQRRSSKTLAAVKPELGINTGNEEADKSGKAKIEVSQTLGLKSFGEMADHVLREGLDVMDQEKRAEMEIKWKELHVEEMELFLKRIELLKEQTELNLAYYKRQRN
uniref:Transcription regulator n=2 Tax=Rhizophora mucronata TaxID=61149 RepID=A0A2P2IYH3_RHIMU